MTKYALVSVSDKSGIVELARGFGELGYSVLCTSGTGQFLSKHEVPTVSIEDYIGFPEILEGRVKTLHPRIHAGLLAKHQDPAHQKQLQEQGIFPISVAVVNLYPFREGLASDRASNPTAMTELIDIGGPTMIRAAAKNFRSVYPVIDPRDYRELLEVLSLPDGQEEERKLSFRLTLAQKVFYEIADYDLSIVRYLSGVEAAQDGSDALRYANEDFPPVSGFLGGRSQQLRYGENPHQRAALYSRGEENERFEWKQIQGKELSYNNMLDADACMRLLSLFPQSEGPFCCIFKHLNPCGAASRSTLAEALSDAKKGDPRSHFGGILGCNTDVDEQTAISIADDFAEIVVAPGYSESARAVLKKKKNLRVLLVPAFTNDVTELRSTAFGVLFQDADGQGASPRDGRLVTSRSLTDEEYHDAEFAWRVCSVVKSNAIVLAKSRMILGVGAGQMSRIDSVEAALHKARIHGHDTAGCAAASDAFFPFPDNIEMLAQSGVSCVVAPSGSRKDDEVISTAEVKGMSLLFMSERHFRH